MLRVAIVEDSADDRTRLRSYLKKFSGECDETIRITEFFDGTSFLESYQPDYDLILLDIEMPHLNGMETAQELRLRLLIFITNVAQYALNGYEVDALDYMIKPVNYYAFALKLKKVRRILRERTGGSLMLPFDGVLRRTPIQSIIYVEVNDHKLCYLYLCVFSFLHNMTLYAVYFPIQGAFCLLSVFTGAVQIEGGLFPIR